MKLNPNDYELIEVAVEFMDGHPCPPETDPSFPLYVSVAMHNWRKLNPASLRKIELIGGIPEPIHSEWQRQCETKNR